MSRVDLTQVWKIYPRGNVVGVKDLTFTIRDKEFLAILGPSGGGKSSTLRMLAGLEEISRGEISFDGKVVNAMGPAERNIALAFESYALYQRLSVYENIAFPLRARKMPGALIEEKVTHDRAPAGPYVSPEEVSPLAGRRAAAAGVPCARIRAPAQSHAARRADFAHGPARARGDQGPHPPPARGDEEHHGVRHPRPGGSRLPVRQDGHPPPGAAAADRHRGGDLERAGQPVRGAFRRGACHELHPRPAPKGRGASSSRHPRASGASRSRASSRRGTSRPMSPSEFARRRSRSTREQRNGSSIPAVVRIAEFQGENTVLTLNLTDAKASELKAVVAATERYAQGESVWLTSLAPKSSTFSTGRNPSSAARRSGLRAAGDRQAFSRRHHMDDAAYISSLSRRRARRRRFLRGTSTRRRSTDHSADREGHLLQG